MMTLTTGLALFFTSVYGVATLTPADVSIEATDTKIETIEESTSAIDVPLTLEQYLSEYYKDEPLLVEIAKCESTLRHYDSKGRVLRGNVDSNDVGVMQINERYHLEKSAELGFDIHTVEGNLAYAKWLFQKYNHQPWSASKPCWGKSQAFQNYIETQAQLALNR